MVNYTLQQLRYLVAVAEHENVSAAARALYVSQPGISAAVAHLESSFGIQCFVRHHARGMTLTPAGRLFVEAAREVLMLADDLRHRANELTECVRGPLALGCCSALSSFFLPPLVECLAVNHPGLDLQIHLGDVDSLHKWLRDGTIELALMYDFNCDSAIYSKHTLAKLQPHALLPDVHRLASHTSVAPADLLDEPLILPNCTRSADELLSVFQSAGARPKVKHRVSDVGVMRGLVSAGLGYTLLNVLPSMDRGLDCRPVKWIRIRGETRPAALIVTWIRVTTPSRQKIAMIDACEVMIDNFMDEHRKMAS